MYTPDEIQKEQRRLKMECITSFEEQLACGKAFFLSFFPNATIRAIVDNGEKSASAKSYLDYRIERIQAVIQQILEAAASRDPLAEFQKIDVSGIRLAEELSRKLLETLVRMVSFGRDLLEDDFIFLGEVCTALDFPMGKALHIVDQIQYDLKKAFFSTLSDRLDEDQQDLCAILMLTAIRADDVVHPAEFKYFENISQLLDHDQARLEHVGASTESFDFTRAVDLPHDISTCLFSYLVEIVMCDRKYDPKESEFIQDVAKVFGFDKQKQDSIIQPLAAALMIKDELFQ